MIHYLCYRRHSYTINKYLEFWGGDLNSRIRVLDYESLRTTRSLSAGTYLFSDIERLNPADERVAVRIWQALRDSGKPVRLVNHPTRSMRRYELLRTLKETGINSFDVIRLTEARMPARYPVFVRPELHLMGVRNLPLIRDEPALFQQLNEILENGETRENTIITEFSDTADAEGRYRKFSAFFIADEVIPRHISVNRNWLVKAPGKSLDSRELQEEEWNYVNENPHREELEKVFRLARIDYGRIDYAVGDHGIEVWEINTNPNMGNLESKPKRDDPRWRVHEMFSERLNDAFRRLDS